MKVSVADIKILRNLTSKNDRRYLDKMTLRYSAYSNVSNFTLCREFGKWQAHTTGFGQKYLERVNLLHYIVTESLKSSFLISLTINTLLIQF